MEAEKLTNIVRETAEGRASVDDARHALGLFAQFAATRLRDDLLARAMRVVESVAAFLDKMEP